MGSLLKTIMSKREGDAGPKAPAAPPSIVIPPAVAPVKTLVPGKEPISPPSRVQGGGGVRTELPKAKKSYAVSCDNVQGAERLAWLWNKSVSQVVDQALKEFLAARRHELNAAEDLWKKADRKEAV